MDPTKSKAPSTEAVARSYFEALAARDREATAALRSPEWIGDVIALGVVLRGPDEGRALFEELYGAFPDLEITIEDVIADGDRAAVRWRMVGTHTGTPLQGVEATGKRVETRAVDWLDIEDGLVTRTTAYFDGMGQARALGMMPPVGSAAEGAMKQAFNLATRARSAIRQRTGG